MKILMTRHLVTLLAALLMTLVVAPGCEGEKTAKELVAIGNLSADKGRLDEALESYNKALEKEAGNVEAKIGLARVLMKQKKYDEAVAQLKAVYESTEDKNLKKSLGGEYGAALVAQAEAHWRGGEAMADADATKAYEASLIQAAELSSGDSKRKAYKLLISLYDQQFEAGKDSKSATCQVPMDGGSGTCTCEGEGFNLAEKSAADRPCASDAACGSCVKHWDDPEAQLALIDKIYTNLNPPEEFDKRLKQAVEDLTKAEFVTEFTDHFEKTVKPGLAENPRVSLSEDGKRMSFVFLSDVKEQSTKDLIRIYKEVKEPAKQQKLVLDVLDFYYQRAKRDAIGALRDELFKGFYGTNEYGLLAASINSFTVDKQDFVNCSLEAPEGQPKPTLETLPPEACADSELGASSHIRVTSSIAFDELSKQAWLFKLKSKTTDAQGGDGGDAKDGGDAPEKDGDAPKEDGGGDAPDKDGNTPG